MTESKEREAFERWVMSWPNYSDRMLARDGRYPDYYGNPVIQGACEAWQARAKAVDVPPVTARALAEWHEDMKTVTYDETKWRLVPVDATEEMIDAMLSDREGNSFERLHLARDYKAALSVAPTPPESEDSQVMVALIAEFRRREQLGIKKYGTTVDRDDLSRSDWLKHLREELMDALMYSHAMESTPTPTEHGNIEALRKDADRYRWLRLHFKFANDSMREIWFDGDVILDEPIELDESIDAAMAAGGESCDL